MRPLPTKLKLVRGNPGKRPINLEEPEPRRGIPKMPSYLSAFPIAVEEWERESKILDDMGVLTEADCATLATRCYLASQIQTLALDIKKEGYVIDIQSLNKKNQLIETSKANPKCIQLKTLLSEYRQLGNLFGLDPSSRTKLKAESPKGGSKIDKFKRKKKA